MLNQYIIGSYNPNGEQVLEDNIKWTISEKVAWQMTKSAQLSYFNNLQYRRVGHRPITGTYSDSNSRALNYKYPDWHQVKFTTPWRSNMVLDASYSRLRYDDLWAPQPEVVLGTVSRYETTTDAYTNAQPTYPDWDDYRDQVFASVSVFTGRHDITAGYQFRYVGQKGKNISTSGMRANFTNTVPVSVNTYNVPIMDDFSGPVQYEVWDRTNAFYVQDKWKPTKKLVVDVGLRFETDFAWLPPSCSATNVFVEARCFSEINGVPDFKTVAPRFSAVYDLRGDGRTALKFAANRYTRPVALDNGLRVNPAVVASDTRSWTVCAAGQTSGCDLNRDLTPQMNELGPSNGYNFGVANTMGAGFEACLFKRVLSRPAASASRQSRRLGRLHVPRSTRSVWRPEHVGAAERLHSDDRHRSRERRDGDRLQPVAGDQRPVQQRLVERTGIGRRLSRRRPIGEQTNEQRLVADGRCQFRQGEGHCDHRRSEQSEFPRLQNRSLWKRRAVVVPAVRCL